MKRKFLILICLILFIVSVAGVSAAEDVNQTITGDTNNVVSNVDTLSVSATEDLNRTIDDDALSVSDDIDVISAKDDGTFTALRKKINDASVGATINLENDYKYDSGFSEEGITIDKKLTINGNGHVIDALGQSRIFTIKSSVTINNVIFKNGNIDSSGGGGAIFSDSVSLSFFGCSFVNNSASWADGGAISNYGSLTVSDCNFVNNSASWDGGAICNYGSLTVDGCSFVNNSASGADGAIHSYYNVWDNITSSTFKNNSPINIHELDFGDDGTFTALQKKIDDAPAGSTINLENDYKYDSGFSIEGITINKKLTINGNGHVIDALGQSRIFSIKSSVTINNVIFKNGKAHLYSFSSGGAIYIYKGSGTSSLESCSFVNNTAGGDGGAIYKDSGTLSLESCSFVNNTAGGDGGAIYKDSGTLSLESCSFVNNSAIGIGGAIFSWANSDISNSNFTKNKAKNGGAIFSMDITSVINSQFVNNSAYGKNYDGGGAIYTSEDFNAEGCSFVNNSATNNGGAILNSYDGSVSLIACSFIDNFAGNHGGAIYSNSGDIILDNSTFENNAAWNYGGVIYSTEGDHLNISNLIFKSNSADFGGVIYISDILSYISMDNCIFLNNYAYLAGAAIYFEFLCQSYVMDNCSFVNNYVKSRNNAVIDFKEKLSFIELYERRDLVTTFTNLKFINNTKIYGGGISFSKNFLSITGRTFFEGGYIYPSGDVYVNIAGKSFKDTFNSSSKVVFDLRSIPSGTWNVNISYSGDDNYASFEINIPITIESSTVLDVPDVTKNYGGSEKLEITLTDSGSPVANADINININGGDYTRTTDNNGKASMPINLNAGTYVATVTYQDISTEAIVTVNKLASKTSLAYTKNAHNSVTLTASVNPSSAGGKVTFNVNGKDYTTTVSDAKATYTLNNLAVGSYDAKATYQGDVNHKTSASSSVKFTVDEVNIELKVPDVTKNYGGPEKLEITLTEDGSPIANADVNININGTYYGKTTDSNGKASMNIDLNAGIYDAIVTYQTVSKTAKITVKELSTKTTLDYTTNSQYSVTLTALINPATAGGNVVFTVNGKDYAVDKVNNGKATRTLSNLDVGNYEAKATYQGDINHKSSLSNSVKFTVKDVKVDISAPDLTKYYHGPERLVVTLKDLNEKPISDAQIKITINGQTSTRTTDSNGQTSMGINLNRGKYTAEVEYGDVKVNSTVTVKPTISGNNVTKIYRNDTQYYATFVDTSGNLLKNTDVNFNINGVFYTRKTNDLGVAKMNINLLPGEYIITAINPVSTEQYSNLIKVLPSIITYDLTKYYKNASRLTFKLLDNQGRPVGAGVSATININGVFYTRQTNASGYLNMNVNLNPGTYIATLNYNGLMASSTVKVLPILEAKDVTMRYRDGTKFEAKLLDGQGKPFAGQTLTFNINGVMYNRITGDDGVAHLNLNLMAGEYIITSMYENGATIANKVTIRS